MKVVVGVDEAGYGPTLGPFVLGFSVFSLDEGGSLDLYPLLSGCVAREASRIPGHLAIDDSKRLYGSGRSLAALELTALTFLGRERGALSLLQEVLGVSGRAWPRWYQVPARQPELPREVSPELLRGWQQRLSAALALAGVACLECGVEPVLEEAFNASLQRTRNKAGTLLEFLVPLLRERLRRYPTEELEIRVDRLGGRRYYMPLLGALFPFCPVRVLSETREASVYEIRHRDRRVTLAFETRSDGRHLPVALASICAKYVREIFLSRLNAHFAARIEGLRPTAGYPTDAQRFLSEIDPDLAPAERAQLIRER